MEATVVYWGYIGIMEKKMEATIVYWGYILGFKVVIVLNGGMDPHISPHASPADNASSVSTSFFA